MQSKDFITIEKIYNGIRKMLLDYFLNGIYVGYNNIGLIVVPNGNLNKMIEQKGYIANQFESVKKHKQEILEKIKNIINTVLTNQLSQ